MARAILLSGSYMLYGRHLAAPDPAVFAQLRYEIPNISGRMDHLRGDFVAAAAALGGTSTGMAGSVCSDRDRFARLQGLRRSRPPKKDSRPRFSLICQGGHRTQCPVLWRPVAQGGGAEMVCAPTPVGFTSRYDLAICRTPNGPRPTPFWQD